jgi:plastocyanin
LNPPPSTTETNRCPTHNSIVNAAVTPTSNKVIPIIVGGTSLVFTPNNVQANPGDVLQFQFAARNHTVTQSTEMAPCTPMTGGLHSGFIPFNNATTAVGTFNVPVTSSDPMFLYCAQATHCQEGMVMTVNV